MKKFLLLTLTFIGTIMLTACGGQSDNSQSISVVGSTSVAPIAEALAEKYQEGIVDIQSVGSSAGIKAAADGTADIGMSSRDLKAEEKSGLKEYKIALDGIAVVVNSKNIAKDLTVEQLQKIYKGEITNWKEVGGKDAPIIVVSREEGSGTRGAFEELVGLENKETKASMLLPAAVIGDGNGSVKQNVASKENAIGYLSLGSVDTTVKTLTIAGVSPTVDNIKNGTYKISRPFILLTKVEPTEASKKFIDYVLSEEGQKIVKEKGYITIN